MLYIIDHVDPSWRCPCGARIKAFDFRIEPDEIALDCRCCQRRLLTIDAAWEVRLLRRMAIEFDTSPDQSAP